MGEKVRIYKLHLKFSFPIETGISSRIPANFHDRNSTLIRLIDLSVHNLCWFLHEIKLIVVGFFPKERWVIRVGDVNCVIFFWTLTEIRVYTLQDRLYPESWMVQCISSSTSRIILHRIIPSQGESFIITILLSWNSNGLHCTSM